MQRRTVAAFWDDIDRAVREGKLAAITAGAEQLKQGILDDLLAGSPGSGREYKRGKRGRVHRASVAGAAPARDYGVLARSIAFQLLKGTNPTALVGVRRTAPYAKYLDPAEGEPEPEIGRRPFVSSAWQRLEPDIRRTIDDELTARLRRLGT